MIDYIVSNVPEGWIYLIGMLVCAVAAYQTAKPIWDPEDKPYLPGDRYTLLPLSVVGFFFCLWNLLNIIKTMF